MKKEKVSEILSQIDEQYIDEAILFSEKESRTKEEKGGAYSGRRSVLRLRPALAAAVIAVAILLGTGAYMIRAEAQEYSKAVLFFEDNGLSVEGLSRSEIKEVYRDITMKRFTFKKTAEVIKKAVPGWEIAQQDPTPEALALAWQQKEQVVDWTDPAVDPRLGAGIHYIREEVIRENWDKKTSSFEKSILKCYRDRQLVWTAEFTSFWVTGSEHFSEGTVVWGQTPPFSSAQKELLWLAFVDESGKILWQRCYDHAFMNEYAAAVLENDDGTWAVISRGDLKFVCLTCVDRDGKEQSFRKTEVGNLGIWNAARLGDGYILHLGSYIEGDYAHLYRMDREGNLTENFFYEGDGCVYHIVDMAEFGGQVYLSAYAVPADQAGIWKYGREEIAALLDYCVSKPFKDWQPDPGGMLTDEELLPRMRNHYTAMLLVCSPEGGQPQTFYSVKGSLGGKLTVSETGQLEWDVESLAYAYYSPATSSFTIGGICDVFRYSFDQAGNLTGQKKTGEQTRYAR